MKINITIEVSDEDMDKYLTVLVQKVMAGAIVSTTKSRATASDRGQDDKPAPKV